MLKPLIHLLAVCNFALAIYGQLTVSPLDPEESVKYGHLGFDKFGGPWKYLTFWNLWIQLIFFCLCVANDIRGRKDSSTLIRSEDFVYATLAFPMGMFVAFVFWSLYVIDRDLVFPEMLDKYISAAANHMMHTNVVPFQLVELLMVQHVYPKKMVGSVTTAAFCFTYLCWCLVVAHFGGFWVYPILGVLSPGPRMAFLLGCSALGAGLYWIGYSLNKFIWGQQQNTSSRRKGKSKRT